MKAIREYSRTRHCHQIRRQDPFRWPPILSGAIAFPTAVVKMGKATMAIRMAVHLDIDCSIEHFSGHSFNER